MTESLPTPNRLDALQQQLDHLDGDTRAARDAADAADPLRDGSYAGDATKKSLVDTPDLEAGEEPIDAPPSTWRSDADML